MADAPIDGNTRQGLIAVSSVDGTTIVPLYADPVTHRLLVDIAGGGSGTVTSVSVVTANGFAGTVATATTTPAITITTTINSPVLAGNGTAISAATTTGSGSTVVLNNSPTFVDDITIGVAASATGSILFKGTTSGTVTLSVADAAGTWTMKLPTTDGDSGQFLQTDGSGNTTWATVTATPGGADTQVQYNNAGALGGITGATSNGTTLTITSGRATTDFSPSSNDGATLGTTALGFADLHLASGGTINWVNGETVITQTNANLLSLSGGSFAIDTNQFFYPGGSSASQLYWDGTNVVLSTVSLAAPVRIEGNAIQLRTGGSVYAVLDTSALATSNKTITFPNRSLTLDNITTATTTNGTGFLKGNGSVISFDNSTYITGLTVGTTTITSGTNTRILYNNSGVLGEYTLTGTGTVVAMQTAPSFLTSITTPAVLASANDSGALGASGTAFSDLFLASGGVINWSTADVTITHATGTLSEAISNTSTTPQWALTQASTGDAAMKFALGSTISYAVGIDNSVSGDPFIISTAASASAVLGTGNVLSISSAGILTTYGNVIPSADDGGTLGGPTTSYSDLFLASGGVINFANNNWIATHSSGILTVNPGDLRVTTAGTNTASVVTVGGTQTLTSKTLTSPAITTGTYTGTQLLAEGASVGLDPALSADGTYTGITITGTAGATLAFGDCIYLAAADSRWELADADSVTTGAQVLIGMCVQAAAADGDPTTILLFGNIRADVAFPSFTISAPVFLSTTAGDVTNTSPTGTDDVVIVLGKALTADSMFFISPMDWATYV